MSLRLSALFLAAVFTGTALADEASVRRGVEARFDGIKVDSVSKTSYAGLYEIVVGETLFYTDEKVNFVFKGEIIDARSQKNLTEERQQKLTAIKFEDLPLDLAIKQVRGNGKRVVAIFADPFCPDRKSTRLNSSHLVISYAVFCLKKKKSARSHGSVPTPG